MPSQPSPAYIHTLTASFASTLDEIPQDMCRHFADLRELDAVLSQSLSGITSRIDQLTEKIENGLASIDSRNDANSDGSANASAENRENKVIDMFRLLHEIAEDTGRIKLGGEDKIRVASLAAEHMNAYYAHLLTLVRRMYDLDAAYALEILAPNTQYPHVHPSALIDPAPENRRGAPRRTVAVQNNSYGLPLETVGRGVNGANGDTPTKRRRIQGAPASINHHSHVARERENDTDDYSTPRRGAAALDAEAYRPGGNTASRARAQGRKVREVRTTTTQAAIIETTVIPGSEPMSRQGGQSSVSAANAMQGVEPTNAGAPHSKSHNQSNRSRVSASQTPAQPPLPQQYPQHYHQQPFVNMPGQMAFAGPPNTYPPNLPLPMMPTNSNSTGYSTNATANMNPAMDAAYHHAMNMNPNLNHGPNVGYPHGMGVGLGLPASLPPPPGSGHSRPHSASLGGRNAQNTGYEPGATTGATGGGAGRGGMQGASLDPLAGGASNSAHTNIKSRTASGAGDNVNTQGGSSAGGLMPVPMMTSLPPVTSLTQQAPISALGHSGSHSQHQGANETRPRSYTAGGHNQSYSSTAYNAPPEVHRPSSSSAYASQSGGPSNHPSMSPVTSTQAQPGYGSSAGPGSYMEKNMSGRSINQSETHPSLISPTTPKEPPPRGSGRDRDLASTNMGGPGILHASLNRGDREPPFRTHSAGSGEREKEREHKANRPRTGTISGTTVPTKYGEERDLYSGGVANTADRNREGHTSSYNNRGPALFHGNMGSSTPSQPLHSHSQSQSSRSTIQRENQPTKMEDRTERDNMAGLTKGSLGFDRILDDRDREREGRAIDRDVHSMSRGAPQDEAEHGTILGHEDVKTPVRRRTANTTGETVPPREGHFVTIHDGGEIIEGQVLDDDSKPYCICNQPSFGQMIACDDSECEYEWFHLACLGITGTPPQGEFICESCRSRRQRGNRKTGRKKGNGGGGGGGRGRAL